MRSVLAFVTLYGFNFFFWGFVGLLRFVCERTWHSGQAAIPPRQDREPGSGPTTGREVISRRLTVDDVAVLIPAHNEARSIHRCLAAITEIVPAANVFVGSDGSTDNTVEIARQWGCNVSDIQPNGGKARVLDYLLKEFAIAKRFAVILILDADSELEKDYFEHALPVFDDPAVAAVAGHAIPRWKSGPGVQLSRYFIAYRIRLYALTQMVLRYGQTWKYVNVSFIVPGFASMYRTGLLEKIDITAPGLVIEDFNMTFELHHKRLGRIAYTPAARCVCQDPGKFSDYVNQVRRWYLGFWQTVLRHGVWAGRFWLALAFFIVEMLLQCMVFLMLPVVLAAFLWVQAGTVPLWLPQLGIVDLRLVDVVTGVFLMDYLLTVLVALMVRKPALLLYGVGFTVLRWVDSLVFLLTLPLAFFVKSDGRWVSPART